MIERHVTLFPHPDSPTMASVRPLSTVNETPSTAWTMPSSVLNEVFRSRTSRRAIPAKVYRSPAALCEPDSRIDPGVEEVDKEVEHDHEHRGEHDDSQRDRIVELAERFDGGV